MLNRGMANAPTKRPRGRPPGPGQPKTQAEIQRAYRERKRLATPDPADVAALRERFRKISLDLELKTQEVARLEARNGDLEGKLKLLEQHHTNRLKEIVMLKQAAAQPAPVKRRTKPR
jgi:hypothetical protein